MDLERELVRFSRPSAPPQIKQQSKQGLHIWTRKRGNKLNTQQPAHINKFVWRIAAEVEQMQKSIGRREYELTVPIAERAHTTRETQNLLCCAYCQILPLHPVCIQNMCLVTNFFAIVIKSGDYELFK